MKILIINPNSSISMTNAIQKTADNLDLPVLDGVECALFIAVGLVKYGITTSKIRRFNPEY